MPKIIKGGGNLTKLWQKQFCTVLLRHGVDARCSLLQQLLCIGLTVDYCSQHPSLVPQLAFQKNIYRISCFSYRPIAKRTRI